MKKKHLIVSTLLFLLLFLLFIFVNSSSVNERLPHPYPYRYCANNCDFDIIEQNKTSDLSEHYGEFYVYYFIKVTKIGDTYDNVLRRFEKYKQEDSTRQHIVLHRRFKRNWWQIWNWIEYTKHPRWRLPYAERDEDT